GMIEICDCFYKCVRIAFVPEETSFEVIAIRFGIASPGRGLCRGRMFNSWRMKLPHQRLTYGEVKSQQVVRRKLEAGSPKRAAIIGLHEAHVHGELIAILENGALDESVDVQILGDFPGRAGLGISRRRTSGNHTQP